MPYLNPDKFATVKTAVCELLDRDHLDLHPDDRAMLEEALKEITEAEAAAAPEDLRQQAIDLHRDGDEIEVDDDAAMSQGDEGAWVQAWLYVPGWGADDDEGCATCRDSIETRVMPCDECGAIDEED